MENKKVLRSTLIGFILLLLSLVITGICGVTDIINGGTGELYGRPIKYGFMNSIDNYWKMWRPGLFAHETAYIGIVLIFVAIFLTLTMIIMSLAKKKPVYLLPALVLGAAIAFLPYILILAVPMAQLGVLRGWALVLLSGVTGLVLFSIFFLCLALRGLLADAVNMLKKAGGEKEEPKAQPAPAAVAGLSEDEVKAIVEKYLAEHVDELHPDGAVVAPVEEPKEEPAEEPQEEPAPVEEPAEEPKEEPAEEPVVEEQSYEEAPAEEEADDEDDEEGDEEGDEEVPVIDGIPAGIANRGKRRRANFETRLKNSEFDLRHKYYDLRDYIKWYGLRNRISIPGDTFSYKRQRYVFVTIVGKHIRVYLGLDPNAYADSTIPVEPAAAKKYEDLPCLLKVKSDLSYRRAKKLVDDLMKNIGIDKPDEDEPKETQKDD